jgi:hypothetical protein
VRQILPVVREPKSAQFGVRPLQDFNARGMGITLGERLQRFTFSAVARFHCGGKSGGLNVDAVSTRDSSGSDRSSDAFAILHSESSFLVSRVAHGDHNQASHFAAWQMPCLPWAASFCCRSWSSTGANSPQHSRDIFEINGAIAIFPFVVVPVFDKKFEALEKQNVSGIHKSLKLELSKFLKRYVFQFRKVSRSVAPSCDVVLPIENDPKFRGQILAIDKRRRRVRGKQDIFEPSPHFGCFEDDVRRDLGRESRSPFWRCRMFGHSASPAKRYDIGMRRRHKVVDKPPPGLQGPPLFVGEIVPLVDANDAAEAAGDMV